MGYQISYGSKSQREIAAEKKKFAVIYRILIIAAVVLSLRVAAPQAALKLRTVLLPGFDDEAAAAFSQMVTSIGAGERWDDSVTAFCREIITNADIQR